MHIFTGCKTYKIEQDHLTVKLEDGEPVLASQERLNLKDPISEFDMLYKLTKIVKEYGPDLTGRV